VSANLLDVALIVLVIVFAVNGYRQGFLVGLMSFVGFFGGALLGLRIGPWLADRFTSDPARVLVSLLVVFGFAVAGQAVTSFLGNRLRNALRNRVAQRVDDVGGSIVSVIAVLVVVWLVAVPLGSSAMPGLARQVRTSAVLGAVNRIMPDQAQALSDALRDTVDTRGFPDVFGGLSPTRVRNVDAPDPALAGSAVVQSSKRSVVKIRGSAPSCSRSIEGTGFVYATDRVLTNAHVVAGTSTVNIEVGGARRAARVVVYDPGRDLAVLYSPNLGLPALRFAGRPAVTGTDAIVVGYPLDGPFDPQPARVRDLRNITGPDIYETATVTREIYTIRALVRSGNSGGPLLSADGAVLGVIFAAAADDAETGFALTAAEASPVVAAATGRTEAVRTQRCA
jgi:S1-C subfamily serine protease